MESSQAVPLLLAKLVGDATANRVLILATLLIGNQPVYQMLSGFTALAYGLDGAFVAVGMAIIMSIAAWTPLDRGTAWTAKTAIGS